MVGSESKLHCSILARGTPQLVSALVTASSTHVGVSVPQFQGACMPKLTKKMPTIQFNSMATCAHETQQLVLLEDVGACFTANYLIGKMPISIDQQATI